MFAIVLAKKQKERKNEMTRNQLNDMLLKQGKKIIYIGRSWRRGYVSRRLNPDKIEYFPSTHRGSRNSQLADFYCLTPSWFSSRYCVCRWYKVVPC